MSLAPNALITLDEAKEFLGIEKELSDIQRAQYENYINAISQFVENYCRRKFIASGSAITEIFDGDGTVEYYAKNIPISGTIVAGDISYRSGTGDVWMPTTGTFSYDSQSGRIYFTDGNIFSKGKDNWKIIYQYGYSITSVPYDLKLAVAKILAREKKLFSDNVHGVSSITFPDHTISYSFDKLPDDVIATFNRYRRIY